MLGERSKKEADCQYFMWQNCCSTVPASIILSPHESQPLESVPGTGVEALPLLAVPEVLWDPFPVYHCHLVPVRSCSSCHTALFCVPASFCLRLLWDPLFHMVTRVWFDPHTQLLAVCLFFITALITCSVSPISASALSLHHSISQSTATLSGSIFKCLHWQTASTLITIFSNYGYPSCQESCKKCNLREKRTIAHIPTTADDAATSNISNSAAIDLSTTTSTNTDNFGHWINTATLSASEDVTLTRTVVLWDSLSDTHQEAENYYCKQQLCTALIATYLIVEITTTTNQSAPEYTKTITPPTQSACDNSDTVEQVDTKFLHIEQHWAESWSSLFPESIRSAIMDLRLAVERNEIVLPRFG